MTILEFSSIFSGKGKFKTGTKSPVKNITYRP